MTQGQSVQKLKKKKREKRISYLRTSHKLLCIYVIPATSVGGSSRQKQETLLKAKRAGCMIQVFLPSKNKALSSKP
jgi:hypothetical protein